MRAIRLTDFSGGLSEMRAPEDFGADAVAQAKGFVIDTPVSFRSQWPIQSFGGSDFTAIRGFSSPTTDYLVGIKTAGSVWWAVAPAVDSATPTVTWNQFSVTSSTSYKLLTEVPYEAAKQTVTSGTGDSEVKTDVILYGKNGLLVGGNPLTGATPFLVYESSSGTLTSFVYTKTYPKNIAHPTIANQLIPDPDVMPRGNVGVLWGDRLILADIEWFSSTGTNQTLSASTSKRYKNAMWFSEAGRIDEFDPLSVVVPCSSDAQIVAMHVLDVGLLIVTTNASGRDGLVLLRGTAGNFRVEVLRSGLAAAPRLTNRSLGFSTLWTETGTVVFVDRLGGVWQTNGSSVVRLDGLMLEPYGPADDDDHTASVGPWLFVSRGKRLLVFRLMGEQGGWTELVTPSSSVWVRSMTPVGNAIWFLSNGTVWRIAVGYTNGPRGQVGSTYPQLTFSTPTVAVEQQGDLAHQRSLWHRVGVRARGHGAAPTLVSVRTKACPALESGVSYLVNVNETVGSRHERVVPAGIGYSAEASGTWTFSGDVEVESVTFWADGGEPVR
jgi:hypothetical protein